jgi:hypothetical protein
MIPLLLYGLLAANTAARSYSSEEVSLQALPSCASIRGTLRLRNDGTNLRVALINVTADNLRANCPAYHVTGFRIGILQGKDAHFRAGTWSSVVMQDQILPQDGTIHFPTETLLIDRSTRPTLNAASLVFELLVECESGSSCGGGFTDSDFFNLP